MTISLREKIMQDIKQNMPMKEFNKIRRDIKIYKKKNDEKKSVLLCNTRLPAKLYQLFIINDSKDLTQNQIWSIENVLRNALKKHQQIKSFIAVSRTDSENAHRVKVVENDRYHYIINGTNVPVHVHIGAIGDEMKSARSYVFYVAERLRKLGFHGRIQCCKSDHHAVNYINYCYKQADTFHQYGRHDFNFRDYTCKK